MALSCLSQNCRALAWGACLSSEACLAKSCDHLWPFLKDHTWDTDWSGSQTPVSGVRGNPYGSGKHQRAMETGFGFLKQTNEWSWNGQSRMVVFPASGVCKGLLGPRL